MNWFRYALAAILSALSLVFYFFICYLPYLIGVLLLGAIVFICRRCFRKKKMPDSAPTVHG